MLLNILRFSITPIILRPKKFQDLVRDCIAGLLVNLSVQDFKDIEGSIHSEVSNNHTSERFNKHLLYRRVK